MDMQTTEHEIDVLSHQAGWLKGNGIWATGRFLSPREWRLVARFHRDAMASAGVRFFLRLAGPPSAAGDSVPEAENTAGLAIATAFALGLPRNAIVYFPVPEAGDDAGLSVRTAAYFEIIRSAFDGTGYRVGAWGSGWLLSPLLNRGLAASVWVGVPARPEASPNRAADPRMRAGYELWRSGMTAGDMDDPVLATLGQPQFGAFVLEPQDERREKPAPRSIDIRALGDVATPPNPSLPLRRGPADPLVVGAIQARLNTLGYGPLRTDGSFGAETEGAVARFQRASLTGRAAPTAGEGTVDAATWCALFEPDATRDLLSVAPPEPEPPEPSAFLSHRWR